MSRQKSRLNQLPQPLMLSRKSNNTSLSQIQKPYRLKTQQSSCQKVGLLSDMKQQLSLIKDGVEKLLTTNEDEINPVVISSVPEVLNLTLKEELVQQRQLEERLRKELQKTKGDHLNMVEEARQAADAKLERVRKEYKEQKFNYKSKIHKLEDTVSTLNQALRLKQEELKKLEKLIEQNHNENEKSLKLFEAKYQSSLSEFKKLQDRFTSSQKEDLATIQHRLYEVQKDNSTLRVQNISLKNDLEYVNGKIERLTIQNSQIKQRNSQLEDRVRIQIKNEQYIKQIQELKISLSQMQSEKTFMIESLSQKTSQYQRVVKQLNQINNSLEQNQQLHSQRLQIVNLQVQLNSFRQRNVLLINQIEYLKEVLEEKQSYIEALQDQTYFVEASSAIKQLQDRCQVLNEEKIKIVKDYQQAINVLQNSERSILRNTSSLNTDRSIIPSRNNNFDEILKQQIRETDQLKISLRQKTQEALSFKYLSQQLQRRIDTMRGQFESQKTKLLSQEKSASKNLQYNYECIKQQLDLIKRKEETLTKKLEMKVDELKKKDEFIQKHLIGKIGKDKDQPEAAYLAEQLERFMELRLHQSSIIHDNVTKLDTPRMYKHPQLLKNLSLCSSIVKQ